MREFLNLPGAIVKISHKRAYDYNEKTGLWVYREVDPEETVHNIVTDAGRVRIHTFAYGTASRTNGLNYIALTDDANAPAAGDTSLASELTTNGLTRVQGTVTLPTGSGTQTVIDKVFTYTAAGPQGVRKSALFDALVGGVMAHEVSFTQRTLFLNDTLTIQYTITIA
jgi:hypothetical protein